MEKRCELGIMKARKAGIEDVPVLRGWYSTGSAKQFLYATPEDPTEFALYILKPHRFMVETEKDLGITVRIGTFALEVSGTNASVGLFIAEEHRGKHYLEEIFRLITEEARLLGVRVLSADIYSDNIAALKVFEAAGFRKFLWFEKNLDDAT